jgi:hypothetical protein
LHPTFDIFKRLADGQPEWVEAVAGLEEAKARMTRLNSNSPGDYFIYSVAGQTVVVESQETTHPSEANGGICTNEPRLTSFAVAICT